MRSDKEIEAEIAALKVVRDRAPTSAPIGGGNPKQKIENDIKVLKERMSDDDIYSHWDDGEDEYPEEIDSALQVALWMRGETDESPAADWAETYPAE